MNLIINLHLTLLLKLAEMSQCHGNMLWVHGTPDGGNIRVMIIIKLWKEYEDNDFPLDIMVMDMEWHREGWTGWS